MIKRILQYALPVLTFIGLCYLAYPMKDINKRDDYTFTVQSKWQSVSVGKHNISEYNYLELCLVEDPNHCISLDVRQDTWNGLGKGDVTTFNLRTERVYNNIGVLASVSVALLVTILLFVGVILIYAFLNILYGGNEND
jgi:hypothetical protein